MNSLVVLYKILRKFYRELKRIEKIFLYTYIIDMATYSFLFIGTLYLSGKFDVNYLLFPILFFPIISGLIMFYGKTVYHGLAFLGVHSFPIFAGIAYFYTQYFHCREHTAVCNANNPIYYAGVAFLVALVFLFQLLYTLYVYLIWKKRIWPLVYEFKHSRHDEIKEMHAIYEVQFPLFHAQIMMIGLCAIQHNISFLFVFYAQRCEGRKTLLDVYPKLDSLSQCFQYNMIFDMFSLYACLCWIVLALSTWNTIRCHINFNRNMSTYITYEPTPPEFESGRKLVIRESNEPKENVQFY
ncbi:hypothetical protein RhiirA1_471968 [Rhizophagus irregularis]|uniref:Uncharacterized protein n=1 Tax=Rhizophagus irregularis TaxID=588596 RepID=A0A2I1F9Q8_9GLOM|nr:hypothetical protein RhiirA1_471968 [Rhizophagus irregularis]PKY31109.1 hypothetical protein RhiirB3_448546 [Rhizophagus irregularis]